MRLLTFSVFLLASFWLPTQAAPVTPESRPTLTTDAGLTYSEWLPAGFAERRHDVPLIIFSHGFGGCAQQSSTLMQALADAGYAVLAPNHKDKACERYMAGPLSALWATITGKGPDVSFGDEDKWSDTTEVSRRNDVEALTNYALSHAPYKDAVDQSRIALMGHSLGGYTVLALAGAWESWRDPRFKCVLALAPFDAPFLFRRTLGAIKVPVMYQTGTDDRLVPSRAVVEAYNSSNAPKYFVALDGASHFAFTELDKDYQQTIAAYSIAFFNQELDHHPADLLSRSAVGQVSDYRHAVR